MRDALIFTITHKFWAIKVKSIEVLVETAAFLSRRWLKGEALLNSLLHTGQRNNIVVRVMTNLWMHKLRADNF